MITITNTEQIGKTVRKVRKGQNLTQEQLAATSGVGIRFIRELEQGKETSQIGKVLTVIRMLGLQVIIHSDDHYGDDSDSVQG